MIPAANRLDPDQCYRAVESKDARFDGCFFTAVRTTGIYCRPSCPAVTPKRQNVEFFPTAAAAHEHGYRACKRCRPDASPGSPEWDRRGDVVARAMRLVADGVVDRDGVAGLARHLHYSERHLNRLMVDELGAGPIAVARAQRATTARILIETTAMSFTAIAFAAGFGSVRQFNDTIREVFAATPGELRAKRRGSGEISGGASAARPGVVAVELAVREPYDLAPTLAFLSARAIAGVEHADDTTYRRSLALPRGHGVVAVLGTARDRRAHVRARRARAAGLARPRPGRASRASPARPRRRPGRHRRPARPTIRRWRRSSRPIPAGACPAAAIRSRPPCAPSSASRCRWQAPARSSVASRRPPATGSPSPTTCSRTCSRRRTRSPRSTRRRSRCRRSRRRTLVELGARAAIGKLPLDVGADRDEARAALLDVPGIGPWTADYVMMRGFGDPDVFLPTDLGVVRGLSALGIDAASSERWRPWRSYAMAHVWSAAADPPRTAIPPSPQHERLHPS